MRTHGYRLFLARCDYPGDDVLTGTAVDPNGLVPFARVLVTVSRLMYPVALVIADKTGAWSFTGVAPDTQVKFSAWADHPTDLRNGARASQV